MGDWLVTIIGLILAPILPLFATKEQNYLNGLRIYFGWKLKNKVDHPEWEGTAMLVCSVNPIMSYSEV